MANAATAPTPVNKWEDITDTLYGTPQPDNAGMPLDPNNFGDQVAQRRADMGAGSDIPPSSILAQGYSTPGYWKSAGRAAGVPTSMDQIPQALMGAFSPPGLSQLLQSVETGRGLAGAHNIAEAGQVLSPTTAMAGQQLGEGNLTGFAGSLTPLIAMIAGAKLGKPLMESGAGRVIKAGSAGVKGLITELLTKSKPLGIDLSGAAPAMRASWAASGPKAPPTAMETLGMTDPAKLPATPGAEPPAKPASTAKVQLPPPPESWTNAEFGNAPPETFGPKKTGIRGLNLLNVAEARTERGGMGAFEKFKPANVTYITEDMASNWKKDPVLPKGAGIITNVTKDGKTATISFLNKNGTLTSKTVEVRPNPFLNHP